MVPVVGKPHPTVRTRRDPHGFADTVIAEDSLDACGGDPPDPGLLGYVVRGVAGEPKIAIRARRDAVRIVDAGGEGGHDALRGDAPDRARASGEPEVPIRARRDFIRRADIPNGEERYD